MGFRIRPDIPAYGLADERKKAMPIEESLGAEGQRPIAVLRRLLAEWLQHGHISSSAGVTLMHALEIADLRSAKSDRGLAVGSAVPGQDVHEITWSDSYSVGDGRWDEQHKCKGYFPGRV